MNYDMLIYYWSFWKSSTISLSKFGLYAILQIGTIKDYFIFSEYQISSIIGISSDFHKITKIQK